MIRNPKDRAAPPQDMPELTPEQRKAADEAKVLYEALLNCKGARCSDRPDCKNCKHPLTKSELESGYTVCDICYGSILPF